MPTISNTDASNPHKPGRADDMGEPASDCPICGGLGYVRENVPVDDPRFGQVFPCDCRLAALEKKRAERLRTLSNLGHLTHMTFDNFVPDGYGLTPDKARNLRGAFELARSYADNPQGWLAFFGGYGSGKTHLAAAVANRVMERGQGVLFVVVPDLLDYLRATYSPTSPVRYDQRFDEVRRAPLLVLDDLGTQSSTPWAQEKLFQILNYRYNGRLPTVITSNQALDEVDLRLRSRLADPTAGTIYTILAPDFRRSGVDQDQSDLSSLSLMHDMTFERFSLREDELSSEEQLNLRKALSLCRSFAEQPDGWLTLTGPYGCGKTHLAAAIANWRVNRGQPALFIVVPDLLDHLRATFNPASQVRFDRRFEEVRTAPLLILDDLGTENASPWAKEKLFQVLNHRYNARLPTVITMVQTVDKVDPRLRTRMLDLERSRVFGIVAPSYRGSPRRRAARQKRNTAHES